VFNRPIGYHTRPGEVCLEPFMGGGSQLIAAERQAAIAEWKQKLR